MEFRVQTSRLTQSLQWQLTTTTTITARGTTWRFVASRVAEAFAGHSRSIHEEAPPLESRRGDVHTFNESDRREPRLNLIKLPGALFKSPVPCALGKYLYRVGCPEMYRVIAPEN